MDSPISAPAIAALVARIRAERPDRIETPLGALPLAYLRDEEDRDYAFVRLELEGALAEIDGETYGRLHGLRIYLD